MLKIVIEKTNEIFPKEELITLMLKNKGMRVNIYSIKAPMQPFEERAKIASKKK